MVLDCAGIELHFPKRRKPSRAFVPCTTATRSYREELLRGFPEHNDEHPTLDPERPLLMETHRVDILTSEAREQHKP